MPICKQADEQPLHEVALAHDRAGNFRFDVVDGRVHRGDLLLKVFEFGGH